MKPRTATSPAAETVARAIKAGMTAARKAFDKQPTADAWKAMLIWSLAWQQIDSRRGMDVAVQVLFSSTASPDGNWATTVVYPIAVLKALYPNESIDALIRS